MIRWIEHMSMATKLRVAILYSAGVAMLVASILYLTGDILSLRQTLAQQVVTLTRSVGAE